MTTVKIDTRKAERLYHRPPYIGTGHWVAMTRVARSNQPAIHALTDAGTLLSRPYVGAAIQTGPDAQVPDVDRVLARRPGEKHVHPITVTPWSRIMDDGTPARLVHFEGSHFTLVDEKYLPLLTIEQAHDTRQKDSRGAIYITNDNDAIVAIVMPVFADPDELADFIRNDKPTGDALAEELTTDVD